MRENTLKIRKYSYLTHPRWRGWLQPWKLAIKTSKILSVLTMLVFKLHATVESANGIATRSNAIAGTYQLETFI